MKIATWNVNSVRAREARLLSWLERHGPDVLCLQELKVVDEAFPYIQAQALGYHAAVHGQKTYNGVAILSRIAPEDVRVAMDDGEDDPQARLISARIGDLEVLSAYFPNGGEYGSEKYRYKLRWMERLRSHLDRSFSPETGLLLCGDFNVAPFDDDVAFLEQWRDGSLTHREVREALEHIRGFGLTDLFRKHHPEGGVYSWWDYRQLGFPKGNGLRIDHLYGTSSIAERCTGAWVDRDERKGKQASDHAPVVVELAG